MSTPVSRVSGFPSSVPQAGSPTTPFSPWPWPRASSRVPIWRYTFDVSCAGSVPEALAAFLQSTDFEDALRNAVSLGGDADTQACIAGSVAEAFYGGVPAKIASEVMGRLDDGLREVVGRFRARHGEPRQPRTKRESR